MRAFADLFAELDETTRTSEKVAALVRYFQSAEPAEAAWALYFLTGRRLPRPIASPRLRTFALEASHLPAWLFEESYDAVGDLAETIALLIPPVTAGSDRPLDEWVHDWILPLRHLDEASQREGLREAWSQLSPLQTLVWNKLLTGGFRVGVSGQLVVRALGVVGRLDPGVLAHRLMGEWSPTPEFFTRLLAPTDPGDDASRPYPFFLAHPLDGDARELGELSQWHVEWKWDGIRCQLLRRRGQTYLWSRGEDLLTPRFPEIASLGDRLPDGVVLDGEILAFRADRPLPFHDLQRRITRKTLSKRLLADVPVIFMAYDLLEDEGLDRRDRPLNERHDRLSNLAQRLAGSAAFRLSPRLNVSTWDDVEAWRRQSRERGVEGVMLKRAASSYGVGRQRGDWWKWKIEPYTLDAVLVSAQPGHGKRANLYTDYTFALWDDDGQLTPFAKAYSGLTDEEIRRVDAFVRKNTVEKFGPVRAVKPELVFELAFEAIQESPRHRSGIAVRFPRMLRWRTDKTIADADTLEAARRWIPAKGSRPTKSDPPMPLFDDELE